jgi:hypothetical protein
VHGDQVEQSIAGSSPACALSRSARPAGAAHSVQNTFGVQFRNDDIGRSRSYHTEERVRLEAKNDASAFVTSLGGYAENEIEWTKWLRTTAGCAWTARATT